MTIQDVQQQIQEEFESFLDWEDTYAYIIDLGKQLESDDALRTEEQRVHGCQSAAWVRAEERDGKIYFTADSDALIVRGLIHMVLRILNGRTPQEVKEYDPAFFTQIGLMQNLSPARMNGLLALINKMKSLV